MGCYSCEVPEYAQAACFTGKSQNMCMLHVGRSPTHTDKCIAIDASEFDPGYDCGRAAETSNTIELGSVSDVHQVQPSYNTGAGKSVSNISRLLNQKQQRHYGSYEVRRLAVSPGSA